MIKNIFEKIRHCQIVIGIISSIIGSLLIILFKEIFKLNLIKFASTIFYNIFVYLTIVASVFIVLYYSCKFVKLYIKNKEIFNIYKSYKYSSNWYMLFAERMIIEEFVKRRKLKIFSSDDIAYNLLFDYVNYIEENYCPDDDVMDMLHSTLNKLRNQEFVTKCLNNLLEIGFITKIKDKEKYYKINNNIFKYETKEKIKEDKEYNKKQKKLYRDMDIMRIKQKLISFKNGLTEKIKDFNNNLERGLWRKK